MRFVVVARRGEELTLYQDGERVGWTKLPADFGFQFTKKPLVIGRLHQQDWEPFFKGAVDELKIWKTAFTASEVAALHCSN